MIKQCFYNFFKRYKYFFICFGMVIAGFLAGAGIFYGGYKITMATQDPDLVKNITTYLLKGIKNINPTEVLSLSIIPRIYQDLLVIAGDAAYEVKVGLTLSAIVAVFAVYGCYKGAVSIVNYINKRQLRNAVTKHGFVPFIIKLLIGFGFSFALLILLHLWKWSFIFVLLLYIVIDSFESIVAIRYVYFSDVSLKKFLFSKKFFNIMSVFLIYQYAIVIIASASWFITPFISLFLMIPVLAYSETNIQYTIITTFKDVIKRK